ncbi:MAG: S9 family peptidase [Lentimicrobiaceae bacterium]|nr:S9 family peptidase [Lentimicrobiaceae bacterium]
MKKTLLFTLAILAGLLLHGQKVNIENMLYAGYNIVHKPLLMDSLNVKGKGFEEKNMLQNFVSFSKVFEQTNVLPADSGKINFISPKEHYAFHYFKFYIFPDRFTKGELTLKTADMFEVYLDGEKKKDKTTFDSVAKGTTIELTLEPKRYEIIIKYLAQNNDKDTCFLETFFTPKNKETAITCSIDPMQFYGMNFMQNGISYSNVSISPNGKYIKVNYQERTDEKNSRSYSKLFDAETGKVLEHNLRSGLSWTPASSQLYLTRKGLKGNTLVFINPATMEEKIVAEDIPENSFTFTPNEEKLIFFPSEEAPKEMEFFNRILDNSDRYNQFRKRSLLSLYDLTTGAMQPLVFGYRNTWLYEVSPDSKFLLFGASIADYTQRPFSTTNIFRLNLETLHVDTLFFKEKYLSGATYSPNGKQLLLQGGPEAFNGIGLNIGNEEIANAYDTQLFLYDFASKEVKPLTKYFNPSISDAVWNAADQKIYLLVNDKDKVAIYTLDPKTEKFTNLNVPEEVVKRFSVAQFASVLAFYGQSSSNADRLYVLHAGKKNNLICLEDLSKEKLENVKLGEVVPFDFTSEDGFLINGRYCLPPNFNSANKYPLLVYYYGGTTPTTRSLEFSYSAQMYAALGYVVYVVNPSGTIGFGQEFSARHVNAWGKRTAEEIVEGTKRFYREHAFIDSTKIGCFGASYGGFMTLYLQTMTDIFTTAISHAGISALSSYWGEGNWGIGYCAAANADSYPWNNKELFVGQSPLFNADKINTPILLLHGSLDDNVPVGESIQMYNALKILGKPVELIIVEGEKHGISDYKKRVQWAKTMQAWFAKWLKEQPEWWNELYPERKL